MEEELTKELAENLMKIKGEVRGIVFRTDAQYVLKTKGKEGLKKVEEELERIGYPIDYEKINTMAFYPIGQRAISLLAIQKVFALSEKDIREMGVRAPKISLIIKLFMRYFLSIEETVKQVPKMWGKHYTIGKLKAAAYEKQRYIVLKLEDFVIHPILCSYLTGYFSTVVQMVVKAKVLAKETKCPFKGDKYHEFLFKW